MRGHSYTVHVSVKSESQLDRLERIRTAMDHALRLNQDEPGRGPILRALERERETLRAEIIRRMQGGRRR